MDQMYIRDAFSRRNFDLFPRNNDGISEARCPSATQNSETDSITDAASCEDRDIRLHPIEKTFIFFFG